MQVWVVCSAEQKALLGAAPAGFYFSEGINECVASCDAVLDLGFEEDPERHLAWLQALRPAVVVVASLLRTCSELPPGFVRVNAWPTFMEGNLLEASVGDQHHQSAAEELFGLLGKKLEWVPDVPGMIAARIVAAIINEAYFTLEAGTATREAINTAMTLGTAYPAGPFAWAEKIGKKSVLALLQCLAQTESRYQPCDLLVREAGA